MHIVLKVHQRKLLQVGKSDTKMKVLIDMYESLSWRDWLDIVFLFCNFVKENIFTNNDNSVKF